MTRITSGLTLSMLLVFAGLAQAKSVSIDFTGASPVEQGLKQVNNERDKAGATTIVQRGGKNVAMTGNTDTSHYLYLQIDPAFKQGLKSAWVTVEYFDEGADGFKLQYDGQADPNTTTADPPTRTKFDTKNFTHQTWHITGFKLAGGEEGGADLRIDDRAADDADGAEFISRVTVSDEDPDFVHFPYAVNKITIDGVANPAEWDGAYTVTLDRNQYNEGTLSAWAGPEDFSGTYRFKWDEQAFYIQGQVKDATPRLNDAENGDYWRGDGMEQFVGLDDSNPEVTDGMVAGTDIKVLVSLGTPPKWSTQDRGVFVDGDATTDLGEIKDNIAIVKTDKGYDFELRIPWSIMHKATVKPSQRIRWHMYANNSKEIGTSEQDVAMSPSGRSNLNKNMASWYRAMLDPKPTQ
jgi:hypothetical protein